MKWLVTIKKDATRESAFQTLRSLKCEVSESETPIPLGKDEEVLSVEGPVNLMELAKPYENMMAIYPDSKMEAY